MLVSADGGKTWETRSTPEPLVDLAVSPADPARWVATTANGIFLSVDEGGTWRAIDPKANVRLAWPEEDALYRIDPGGPVWVSADGGETWEERGSTGGEPRELDGGERRRALRRPARRDRHAVRRRRGDVGEAAHAVSGGRRGAAPPAPVRDAATARPAR